MRQTFDNHSERKAMAIAIALSKFGPDAQDQLRSELPGVKLVLPDPPPMEVFDFIEHTLRDDWKPFEAIRNGGEEEVIAETVLGMLEIEPGLHDEVIILIDEKDKLECGNHPLENSLIYGFVDFQTISSRVLRRGRNGRDWWDKD